MKNFSYIRRSIENDIESVDLFVLMDYIFSMV